MANEIELHIETNGVPEAVRAVESVRVAAGDLASSAEPAGAAVAQALDAGDLGKAAALERQVGALAASMRELQVSTDGVPADLREVVGAARAAGAAVVEAANAGDGQKVAAMERQTEALAGALRELAGSAEPAGAAVAQALDADDPQKAAALERQVGALAASMRELQVSTDGVPADLREVAGAARAAGAAVVEAANAGDGQKVAAMERQTEALAGALRELAGSAEPAGAAVAQALDADDPQKAAALERQVEALAASMRELQVSTDGVPADLREVAGAARAAGAAVVEAANAGDGQKVAAMERQTEALAGALRELAGSAEPAGAAVAQALDADDPQKAAALERQVEALAASMRELQVSTDGVPADLREVAGAARAAGAAVVEAVNAGDGQKVAAMERQTEALAGALRELHGSVKELPAALRGLIPEEAPREVDELAERLRKLDAARQDVIQGLETLGNGLTIGVTVPMAAAGGAATTMGLEFGESMTQIVNLAGVAQEQVDAWGESLLEMAPELQKTPQDLANGLLVVTSAGERGAAALDVLADASKASTVGLGETGTIARTTTAAMSAYEAQNLSSKRATEILLATAREGNFEVSQLAGSMGQVLPVAAAMGVQFDEVGGFIATFTRLNGDASQSITGLRSFLSTLLAPSEDAEKVLKKVGLSAAELREQVKEKGLTATLLGLVDALNGDTAALAKVIPNIEGLVGVLGTAGLKGKQFAEITANVTNSVGILDEAFARAKATDTGQFREAAAELAVLAVRLGSELAPALVVFLHAAEPVIAVVSDIVQSFAGLPEGLQTSIVGVGLFVMATGPAIRVGVELAQGIYTIRAASTALAAAQSLGGIPALLTATGAAGTTAATGVAAGSGALASMGALLLPAGGIIIGLGLLVTYLIRVGDEAEDQAARAEEALTRFSKAIREMGETEIRGELSMVTREQEALQQQTAHPASLPGRGCAPGGRC